MDAASLLNLASPNGMKKHSILDCVWVPSHTPPRTKLQAGDVNLKSTATERSFNIPIPYLRGSHIGLLLDQAKVYVLAAT